MIQQDPSGEVIEAFEGESLLELIEESKALAVYFCKSNAGGVSYYFFK